MFVDMLFNLSDTIVSFTRKDKLVADLASVCFGQHIGF